MSTVLWIVGTVVFILFFLAIFATSYLRAVKMPHSKKMATAQRHMDKKTGATEDPLPASTEKKSSEGSKSRLGLIILTMVLLLALAGIVIHWRLYVFLMENPRLSDVGSWSWHHWLPLLVFFTMVWFAIELIVPQKQQVQKTLKKVLIVVVFMLFVGASVIGWFGGVLGTTSSPRASCPAFSSSETHSCVLTEDWSLPITTYERTYAGEYNFCVVAPKPDAYESKKVGLNTFEARSLRGMLPIQYRLVAGTCPDTF